MKLEFLIHKEARKPRPVWIVEGLNAAGDAIERSEHTSRLRAFNNLWWRNPGQEMFYVIVPVKAQAPSPGC